MSDVPNTEQAEYWNADEARHWIDRDLDYEAMLRPFTDRILGATAVTAGERVLDVGCGCGNTTLAAARAAAPGGSAVGVDLSVPMTDFARERAEREGIDATFEVGDAQVHPFVDASFDVAVSRFGVMFFADPVAAFANIARALRPGGRAAFACWQDVAANEWMLVPGAAIAAHVAFPVAGDPNAPGPFSLADPERIRSVLTDAGFEAIEVSEARESLLLGGGPSIEGTIDFLRSTGFGRTVLAEAAPEAVEPALAALRDALVPYHTAEGVRLAGAAWIATARRPT